MSQNPSPNPSPLWAGPVDFTISRNGVDLAKGDGFTAKGCVVVPFAKLHHDACTVLIAGNTWPRVFAGAVLTAGDVVMEDFVTLHATFELFRRGTPTATNMAFGTSWSSEGVSSTAELLRALSAYQKVEKRTS